MAGLAVGDEAPQFTLPVDGGGTIRLTELRGKIVVLFFYPQDDTASCTREAIDFSRLEASFNKAGAVVVGISPDTLQKHEKFRAKHALTTQLASDESRDAIEAYGVWAEKSMYGRKYMGVVRTTVLIDRDGKIARIWPKVRVPGHAEEVLEAVAGL
ncbi:peroxiredoxin [Mesorhizobium marinum]|uniref:thioredoxin-dependent peroxiredoxin n=1 Tax=Mesorhizobium marinum TaxID=3228790 RepID=A0ABV3R706_9HYPH